MRGRAGHRAWKLIVLALVCAACGRIDFAPVTEGPVDASRIDGSALDAAALDAGRCPASTELCTALPALPAAPVLDGLLEPCLSLHPIAPVAWTDPAPLPAGIAARAAIAWWPEGLYVYVEVDDPDLHPAPAGSDPYCGDGVEIYVDDDGSLRAPPSYDDPGTVQLIVAAPAGPGTSTSASGRWVGGVRIGPWEPGAYVVTTRPGGYLLEALLDAAAIALPHWAPTDRVGIDLSINVSTPDGRPSTDPADCGVRLGQYFLSVDPSGAGVCGGLPFCNASAFCTPTLTPR